MSTAPTARTLRPLPGDGLLARRGDLVLLCAARSDRMPTAVLDALDEGGDGPALARRLTRLLADAGAPPLVALGPAGAGLAMIVHGAARAVLTLEGGELVLDGRDAATYVDRLLAECPTVVRAWLVGPAGADDLATRDPARWARLDAGCVPAGGFLLAAGRGGREPDPPQPTQSQPAQSQPAQSRPAQSQPVRPDSAIRDVGRAAPNRAKRTESPPAPPQVLGVDCKNDHFNEPSARFCAVCGISMAQLTLVARPPLGVLVLDDGATFRLDTDYVLGRDPDRHGAVAAGTARPLRVADDVAGVSRVHAKVTLEGWSVRVVDLGSANGTHLCRDGGAWQRLTPHSPVSIQPGTHVAFGRRGFRYESHRAVVKGAGVKRAGVKGAGVKGAAVVRGVS